jgi:hypothetical protein
VTDLAFKFTRPDATAPFTGFAWQPGEWVEAEGELALCRNGIHACRVEALPRWIGEELWRIEVDDVEIEHEGVVIARRGRLLEQVESWNDETARELARSCAARARELAEEHPDPMINTMCVDIRGIAESRELSSVALSMYCTAHAADLAVAGGYAAERRRQAEWLHEHLHLDGVSLRA